MRFKADPSTHPEYVALRQRSEFWATVWGFGHVFFILFLALIPAGPLSVALDMMLHSDMTKERAWELVASTVAAPLLMAAIGFGVRQYAAMKGRV